MITNYINDSCTDEWLHEMLAINDEAALEPLHEHEHVSRVVSRDAVRGCAPMESEVTQ